MRQFWRWKSSNLKYSVYGSFCLFIVVPILCTLIVIISVIQWRLTKESVFQAEVLHQNISSDITYFAKDSQLKLSQYLLINDDMVMDIAAQATKNSEEGRKQSLRLLQELFQFMKSPTGAFSDVVFFYSNGDYISLESDLSYPQEELRNTEWYQEALAKTDVATSYIMDMKLSYSLQNLLSHTSLLTLFAPRKTDSTGNIEMVCLYSSLDILALLEGYSGQGGLVNPALYDQSGNLFFSSSADTVPQSLPREQLSSGVYRSDMNGKNYLHTPILSGKLVLVSEIGSSPVLGTLQKVLYISVAVALVLFLLFFLYIRRLVDGVVQPISSLVQAMSDVEKGKLDTVLPHSKQPEINRLVVAYNKMAGELDAQIIHNGQIQKELYQEEIRALQSNINPHFLTNTLSTIRFMAIAAHYDSIRDMVTALSDILNSMLNRAGNNHTVWDELHVLKSYIYIMKIRHMDSFSIDYAIDEGVKDLLVPKMILQPILENSIIHGFEDMDAPGFIQVKAYQQAQTLVFEVTDNGKGMSPQEVEAVFTTGEKMRKDHLSVGIFNTHRRIQLQYGEGYGICMESVLGAYTKTILNMPVEQGKHQDESKKERHDAGSCNC